MRNTRPRTFEEVVAAQDPTKMASLTRGDRFVDPSVNAFHGEASVNEDRFGTGEWRVEYFDDDGGCYVTIFAGPAAERKVRHSPWHHLRATSGRSAQEEAQHFIRCPACGRMDRLP
jgi:hypothetical protein